ncbi:hypothetical protein NDR89_15475 [Cupriavidus gilardii]|uniref:Uncharacterized protein n=1 Tax=Cupriavidus gilardii TaxID=82541 RepID=A0ABY4W266_9BURK|nr:hypothetical protein [Cupriavidus gilardii]USE81120.1 hypothetical protein NDR89_15475 [Cupriavidus gilardii]
MNDPTPLSALAQAAQTSPSPPSSPSFPTSPPSPTPSPRLADAEAEAWLQAWIDAMLLAARQLNAPASPEQLRNAAAWAARGQPQREAAVVELAASAGLSAQFVDLPPASLSPVMQCWCRWARAPPRRSAW